MTFHPLHTTIALPPRFTYPFCYKPHPLCIVAAEQLIAHIEADEQLMTVAREGKMFGVLVVKDKEERLGYVAAYSGTTCYDFDNTFFVPSVYDYLQDDGFFKIGEREITAINHHIDEAENNPHLINIRTEIEQLKKQSSTAIEDYRHSMDEAKKLRDARREAGCTADEEQEMQNESRFMKAEMKRLKTRKEKEIAEITQRYETMMTEIRSMKQQRKDKSDALQDKLFRHFEMLNKDGEKKNVCNIFAEQGAGIPPAGTGECCAPKMIQYAYAHDYHLVAMAEFWYGKTPAAEIRHHLHYYPSCMGKCKPLLTYMLRGIAMDANPMEHSVDNYVDNLYEDDYLIVINKPSGMPTVDGKINTRSAENIVREMRPNDNIKAVHRLDMDTSGIVVFAKDEDTYVEMQRLFAERQVKKRYTAVVEGEVERTNGRISLPLSPDYINRPMQMVDHENGKEAVTSYRVINSHNGQTRISLVPITGRTHQLRVHCASSEGLNNPIVGDNLYGTPSERLLLHASYVEFIHPYTGNKISVKSEAHF